MLPAHIHDQMRRPKPSAPNLWAPGDNMGRSVTTRLPSRARSAEAPTERGYVRCEPVRLLPVGTVPGPPIHDQARISGSLRPERPGRFVDSGDGGHPNRWAWVQRLVPAHADSPRRSSAPQMPPATRKPEPWPPRARARRGIPAAAVGRCSPQMFAPMENVIEVTGPWQTKRLSSLIL